MRLIFVLLLSLSANTMFGQKKAIVIAKIKNLPGDSVLVGMRGVDMSVFPKKNFDQTIKQNKNGGYNYSLPLKKPGEFTLYTSSGEIAINLYVEPSDSLVVVLNAAEPDRPALFYGRGSVNNKVLVQLETLQAGFYGNIDYQKMSANQLAASLENLYKKEQALLQKNSKLITPVFLNHQVANSTIKYMEDLLGVPYKVMYMQGKTGDGIYPDGYWNLTNKLKNEDRWIDYNSYVKFLTGIYPMFLDEKARRSRQEQNKKLTNEERAENLYSIMKEQYKNRKVLAAVVPHFLTTVFQESSDVRLNKDLLDDYLEFYCRDKITKTTLLADYRNKLTISPGQVSPNFELVDQYNKKVSLSDLKGKVVYVDFWASWCGPCRSEMINAAPALHKKFESNKDVSFVFISLDDKLSDWKTAIAEDKIDGIHLLADGGTEKGIARLYSVTGVPRYMIITKDGKIFDNNAPRPSDNRSALRINEALELK